jgi:hypothetical protein
MLKVTRTDRASNGAGPGHGADVSAPRLGREIALALAIKAALLYGIWSVFFSQPSIDSMTDGMDPSRVSAAVIAPTAFDSTNYSHQERSQ